MGNLLAYSGSTTKIRAIRSRLLTDSDYSELSTMKSVTEALGYLKRHPGYQKLFADIDETTLHRGEVEKILNNAIFIDFQKIYRFTSGQQRNLLDLYFQRYEIAILKRCMRMIFDHRDITLDLTIFKTFFEKHSDIDLQKISESRTLEEFMSSLQGSIYFNALDRLSHLTRPTLWDYEMAIDLFYFKWFWKNKDKMAHKEDKKIFMDSYGTKMDLLNVRWINRSKKYFNMPFPEIYAHLIPVQYRLKKEDIQNLVEASTMEEFNTAVKNTYYGRHYPEYSSDTLDSTYNMIRCSIQQKNALKNPYSIATVISFLFEKEHEIDKLTTVLECIRYGLTQDEILEFILRNKK